MKMLKNGLEVDGFATSRIPIQSPLSMKRVDVLRYVAHPPARPAHVHPDPHAGAVAVAVAVVEPVDEVPVLREQKKKRYKNSGLPSTVPKCVAVVDTRWLGNVNAGRHDDPPNDDAVVKWGVSRPVYP